MLNNLSPRRKKDIQDIFLTILKKVIRDEDLSAGLARDLVDGTDWVYFWQLAVYHRAENLVYVGMKRHLSYLPAELSLRLKGRWLQSEISNQKKLTSIAGVLAEFNKLEIEVIPIKGLFLSKALYGDINFRGLAYDLDIFVKSQFRSRIEDQLKKQGYLVEEDKEPEGFQGQKNILKDNLVIDLHWSLSPHWQDGSVLKEMWRDAHAEHLNTASFLSLSLEDSLIQLSVHLAESDCYSQLIYVGDITRFIRIFQDQIDWDKLSDKALRYRLSHSLYYALLLCRRFLGSEIPATIWKRLKPGIVNRLFIYPFIRRENFFSQTFIRRLVNQSVGFVLFDLVEARGIRDYLRVIRLLFFVPEKDGKISLKRSVKRFLKAGDWLFLEVVRLKNKILPGKSIWLNKLNYSFKSW